MDGSGNTTRSVGIGEVEEFTYAQYLALKTIFVLTEVSDKKLEEKQEKAELPRPKSVELDKKPVAPAAERP